MIITHPGGYEGRKDRTMKKTRMMVYIAYDNGKYGINRRVWEDEAGRLMVKIEGTWRELCWYEKSVDFIVRSYID